MPRKKTLKSQRKDIENANAAKSVLDADVFKAAMEYVESAALRQCRHAKSPEEAWRGTLRARAAQDLRAVLHAYVANGESAAREMSEEREEMRAARAGRAGQSAASRAAQASVEQQKMAAHRETLRAQLMAQQRAFAEQQAKARASPYFQFLQQPHRPRSSNDYGAPQRPTLWRPKQAR